MSKTEKKGGDWSAGEGFIPGRETLGPLALMFLTPIVSIAFFHVCAHMNGDFVAFGGLCYEVGFWTVMTSIWPNAFEAEVWQMILSFMAFELALMKLVPGKRFEGSLTPQGNTPVYTANGMACYLITLFTLLLLAYLDIFDPARVYDKFGNILSSMNVFAWVFCFMLLLKGHVAPSSSDSGSTGNVIQDFYWGMELYPRIFGWDVKVFTNCRSGMMYWAVGIVCYCFKNAQLHDGQLQPAIAASVAIQLVYITKFFHWEAGYLCSMDIQHDRAGYYICWGCLNWVPAVYTSQAFYLTKSAPDLSATTAALIALAGFVCVFINYDSDNQRFIFRQNKGHCKIWGRDPKHLVATYESNGKTKTSLLLLDGWWRVARHFHYIPEILASFFWSLPALDTGFVIPYFYVIYLTILLTDRAFRDDDRCRSKYGEYWDEYCKEVPYKIIPGLL